MRDTQIELSFLEKQIEDDLNQLRQHATPYLKRILGGLEAILDQRYNEEDDDDRTIGDDHHEWIR